MAGTVSFTRIHELKVGKVVVPVSSQGWRKCLKACDTYVSRKFPHRNLAMLTSRLIRRALNPVFFFNPFFVVF